MYKKLRFFLLYAHKLTKHLLKIYIYIAAVSMSQVPITKKKGEKLKKVVFRNFWFF